MASWKAKWMFVVNVYQGGSEDSRIPKKCKGTEAVNHQIKTSQDKTTYGSNQIASRELKQTT